MILVAPDETYVGMNMMMRSLAGEEITFTRFKIGNGTVSANEDVKEFTDLVNPLIEFGIVKKERPTDSTMVITGSFNTSVVNEDFRCREIGLFCKGEDGEEVLYAYAHSGEEAGMLKKNTTGVTATQSFAFSVTVSSSANITAVLTEATIYVTKEEFSEHIQEKNPHNVTAETVGLDKVPNVVTNDQTPTYSEAKENSELVSGEKLGVAFGKIAKAVKSFIAHLTAENPHKINTEAIGAANEEHNHSTNEITSGILGVARGGTGVTSYSALSGKLFTCGYYAGNGEASRVVDLGFRPRAVLVMDSLGRTNYMRDGEMVYAGGLAVGYFSVVREGYYAFVGASGWIDGLTAVSIESTGFCVGYDEEKNIQTNADGTAYHYIAIR